MAEYMVTGFLALSLVAYVIAGGADFGVGILELLAPKHERARLRRAGEHALAPVWEANHIWIIVALVILFVAFPKVHVQLTTSLHLPLALMLIGIVLRGTAFTFRYYDVQPEDENATDAPTPDRVWTWLFTIGSLLVPLTFGHLAAALSRGQLMSQPAGFAEAYLQPWLGLFPLACGVFTVVLFAWLAAVFLVGEQAIEQRTSFIRRARAWTIALPISGLVVSLCAWIEGVPWLATLVQRPAAASFGVLATLALGLLWMSLKHPALWPPRIWASMAASCVLGGYFGAVYPVALELRDAPPLTWPQAAAGPATLEALAWALCLGSLLILPGLGLLYRLFKSAPE